jgi:hypothetical protein
MGTINEEEQERKEENKILSESCKISIKKIGQQIGNANDLSCGSINEIGKTILDWQYRFAIGKFDFLNDEEIYDNSAKLDTKIIFTLQDGSKWRYTRGCHQCILHSFFDISNEIGVNIFECLDEKNLFKCGDCNTFLRKREDITKNYYAVDGGFLLFPKEWNDNGIIAWCKKRQKQEDEYEEEKDLRELWRKESEKERSNYETCFTCIHSDVCFIDEDDGCDDWED